MPGPSLTRSPRRKLRSSFQKTLLEVSRHRDARVIFSRWLGWCMARDMEDMLHDPAAKDAARQERRSAIEQGGDGPIDEGSFETLRTIFDTWWRSSDDPQEGLDMLGRVYMDAVLGKKTCNQFFTPWGAARLIAGMSIPADADGDQLSYQRFLDPACGAGVLSLAAATVLAERGRDLLTRSVFVAWDIDMDCSRMTWLQLTRSGIPAVVVNGNSLTGDIHHKWGTPALAAFVHSHGTDPLTDFSPDVVLANPPFGAKPERPSIPTPK